MTATIYHNPRCSKSRQALALLEEKGVDADIRLYLNDPLNTVELKSLLAKLNIPAHDILRSKGADYKEAGLSKNATDEQIFTAIAKAPKLLERPIVVTDKGARIGRPTEAILEIL